MTDSLWLEWAKKRYNTDEEGVRRIMAERSAKALEARRQKQARGIKHRGGFSDPEFARKMGAIGKSRGAHRPKKGEYTESSERDLDSSGDNGVRGTQR
jgi:hypothetical protein